MRTRASRLIVNHEPTIVKSAELSKYAVERGHPAYLTCRAVCVPGEADFAWFMESDVLSKKVSCQFTTAATPHSSDTLSKVLCIPLFLYRDRLKSLLKVA